MKAKEGAKELWAVVHEDGTIAWSRGGSSTKPHLMIYDKETTANKALNNRWIHQVINPEDVVVKKIYRAD